jgi:hypothetical protein
VASARAIRSGERAGQRHAERDGGDEPKRQRHAERRGDEHQHPPIREQRKRSRERTRDCRH